MKNKRNICMVIGAGASFSLVKEKLPLSDTGKASPLPLGNELIERISSYRKKSISWYLSYILYQLIDDLASPIEKYFEFSESIERYFPDDLQSYSENEKSKVKSVIDILQNYFEEPEALQPGIVKTSFSIDKRGPRTSFNFGNECTKDIFFIFEASSFIGKQYSFLCQENKNDQFRKFETVVFFLFIKEWFSTIKAEQRKKFKKNKKYANLVFESIYEMIYNIVNSIRDINFKKTRGANNTVIVSSIWEQSDDFFAGAREKINEHIDFNQSNPHQEICKFINSFNMIFEDIREKNQPSSYSIEGWRYVFGVTNVNRIVYTEEAEANAASQTGMIDFKRLDKVKRLLDAFQNKHISSVGVKEINLFIYILIRYRSHQSHLLDTRIKYGKIFPKALLRDIFRKYQYNEDHTIKHLQNIFKVSNLVFYYQPISIDHFMVNIEYFAPYEFYYIASQPEKLERKEVIHKYAKYLIANEISYSATYTYFAKDSNYIKRILYNINLQSHFSKVSAAQTLKEGFRVINFNYDMTFIRILYDLLGKNTADKIIENNIEHIYGQVYLTTNEGKIIFDFQEDSLWESIFLSYKNSDGCIDKITVKGENMNLKTYTCPDLLKQCSDSMRWIAEKEADGQRKKMQSWLQEANELYFLGFGFDKNNLYNIGLINENDELDISWEQNEVINIFVAKGNPQIIITLATLFDTSDVKKIGKIYFANINNDDVPKGKLFVSLQSVEKALSSDFPLITATPPTYAKTLNAKIVPEKRNKRQMNADSFKESVRIVEGSGK